jgi:predicted metal-binding membrane protein
MLLVTGVAWLVNIAVDSSSGQMPDMGSAGMAPMSSTTTATQMSMSSWVTASSLPKFLSMWSLMLVAMMTPLLIAPLRHVRARSLPRRRARAILVFVLAYAGVWTFSGAALLDVASLLERTYAAPAIALGVAVFWQLTPIKQRCLNRHHSRPPLAPFGRAADLDTLWFGARSGCWCFGSCWSLMLLTLVISPSQIAVMTVVTVWIWAEGFDKPIRPTWHFSLPTTAARILSAAILPPILRQPATRIPTA